MKHIFLSRKGSQLIEIKKTLGRVVDYFPVLKTENTIGGLYTAITEMIGFKCMKKEKQWASPYGTNRFVEEFYRFYELNEEGGFVQNKKHFPLVARFCFGLYHQVKMRIKSSKQKRYCVLHFSIILSALCLMHAIIFIA
ncbi:hypothetical protein D3H35_27010 [Cohnella faecalis]|uniref:Uncharacterized protein n=1 Tax=Cohnella faecalis TaxID=2315694 RepID=A0A398CDP3_9BACL|nr:hypothetical protein D3H35_27010 [Cohnella faecalis]